MTYWFTVAKTGQTKTFHQICICLKAMQQISLVLGHRLPGHGVYGEQEMLNPFINYLDYCKEHTAQCKQPRYVYRLC